MWCLSVAKNVLNTTFELVNWGRPFLRCMCFKQWSRQSLMWNAQKSYNNWDIIRSIVFRKASIKLHTQSLYKWKESIKPLTAFHTLLPYPKELELMYKFLDTNNHVCKIRMQNINGEWYIGHAQIQRYIVIVHYKLATTVCIWANHTQ